MKKTLLSVAGYDPSGGAGAGLDVRVFESLGFRGSAVLTAATAQNTRKVGKILPLPASFIELQYRTLVADIRFSGIKIGMIGTNRNLDAVAAILAGSRKIPRVIDPVFRSSSGGRLLESKAVRRFLDALRGEASLITPNLEEAGALTGRPVQSVEDMEKAALRISEAGGIPCLVKGGHLRGDPVDVLCTGEKITRFDHPRTGKDVRGTGCFLSSAILAYLARGGSLEKACERGIALTAGAIRNAERIGKSRRVFDLPL